ncbi:insulinase family protein [Promicromonospora sp. CA-289599]|uniref:insulinase family protein n=1 Tax=Promicromonospora sp. CA-289599 TaxID=3240014 RepID=UPI003D8D0A89
MTTTAAPQVLIAHSPGRTSGGLSFRVGHADETLPTSGTTALVVALALRAVERPGLDLTASVGPAVTQVRVNGSPERVRATLRELARALADLPVQHRGTETRVLQEAAAGEVAVPPWRFGLSGYGLGPNQRTGLHRVTDTEIRAWARDRFTGTNAVAWVAGEMTDELELPLPAGTADRTFVAPELPVALATLPAEAPAGGTRVRWESVVPDEPALRLLAEVARRAVFQNLRHEQGWTYDVQATVESLDGRMASFELTAGLRPQTAAEATGEFLDTLGRLRYAVADDELEVARGHLLAVYDEPHQDAVWLSENAVLTLLGMPVPSHAERRAALVDVTAADVVEVARQVWDTGLLVTPVGSGWAGLVEVTPGAGDSVTGTAFERVDADATVWVGEEGATVRDGRATATVRFDRTAALLAYPDGGRLLIGLDGARVPFEPTLHEDLDAAALPGLIDERLPDGLVIPVPRPRSPEPPGQDRVRQVRKARSARETADNGLSRTFDSRSGALRELVLVCVLSLGALVGLLGALFCGVTLVGWLFSLADGERGWQEPVVTLVVGLASAGLARLCMWGLTRPAPQPSTTD